MDLKRVALGLHKGSFKMADRFKEEAFKRVSELEAQSPNAYLKKLVVKMKKRLDSSSKEAADDALMFSTLFQNYALKNSHN